VFESIGNHAQREGFHFRKCFIPAASVNHYPWEIGYLGNPSAIAFLIDLDFENHWIEVCHGPNSTPLPQPYPD